MIVQAVGVVGLEAFWLAFCQALENFQCATGKI
jgi:hypothetical protein